MITKFPPHELADPNGLLAVGGDVEPESLLLAYRNGIFPWPVSSFDQIAWFSPPERAVLFLDKIKISRSLRKLKANNSFLFKTNERFESIIEHCSNSKYRKGQSGTWITRDIIDGYTKLHKKGYAHSIECYHGEDLVGGLYGVSVGRMFAGESMFYLESGASKLSLLFLVESLQAQGVHWIDCQQMTPLFESFGAVLLKRSNFLDLLEDSLKYPNIKL